MDKARIAAIWTELKEYGDETQLGFPLSTIKVGELAELISENAGQSDTIERLTKEIEVLIRQVQQEASLCADRTNERDAALAEVERLKTALRVTRDATLAEVQRLKALLQSVVTFAEEAHAKWDADEDMRVGKMLIALAGGLPRYRPDTDAIHAALKS